VRDATPSGGGDVLLGAGKRKREKGGVFYTPLLGRERGRSPSAHGSDHMPQRAERERKETARRVFARDVPDL